MASSNHYSFFLSIKPYQHHHHCNSTLSIFNHFLSISIWQVFNSDYPNLPSHLLHYLQPIASPLSPRFAPQTRLITGIECPKNRMLYMFSIFYLHRIDILLNFYWFTTKKLKFPHKAKLFQNIHQVVSPQLFIDNSQLNFLCFHPRQWSQYWYFIDPIYFVNYPNL